MVVIGSNIGGIGFIQLWGTTARWRNDRGDVEILWAWDTVFLLLEWVAYVRRVNYESERIL
jgi:hypothetical protein